MNQTKIRKEPRDCFAVLQLFPEPYRQKVRTALESAEDSGVPFQFYGNKAPISRVTLRDCCLGASLAARVEGDTCDLRFADITLYDRQPQAVCPAMLDEQRGDAMILLRDAKRISFERVRLFGEKRARGLHAENCTFDGQDVRLIK